MSSQPVLVVIGVAIVVNLIIMGVLLAMLVARRRPVAMPSGVMPPAQYRYDMAQGLPTAVGPVTYMNDEPSEPPMRVMDDEFETPPDATGVFRDAGESATPRVEDAMTAYFAAGEAGSDDESPPGMTAMAAATVVSEATEATPATPATASVEPASPAMAAEPAPATEAPAPAFEAPAQAAATALPEANPDTDPLTGLDGPLRFDGRIRDEDARFNRYRRPVSVVLFELDGLDRLADLLGPDARTRILKPVGQSIRRQARATDYIARIGEGRFAALLPETDEVQAINFVERVRTECDRWLASGAVSMRLAIGWSSPPPGSQLSTALRVAQDRLDRDRRRATGV